MSISKDLFLALLSMDAYNRGYGAGISDAGDDDPDGLGETGFIGTAEIKTRAELGITDPVYDAWQDAGFYAVAYTITDGSQIDGLETGDVVIS